MPPLRRRRDAMSFQGGGNGFRTRRSRTAFVAGDCGGSRHRAGRTRARTRPAGACQELRSRTLGGVLARLPSRPGLPSVERRSCRRVRVRKYRDPPRRGSSLSTLSSCPRWTRSGSGDEQRCGKGAQDIRSLLRPVECSGPGPARATRRAPRVFPSFRKATSAGSRPLDSIILPIPNFPFPRRLGSWRLVVGSCSDPGSRIPDPDPDLRPRQ